MNCRKVTHLLSAYMDGELPGVECLQIRDHLKRCEECCAEYNELLSMKRLLGRLRVQEPSQDLAAGILQSVRIDSELRAARSPFTRFHQIADYLRSPITAARAVGIGVGLAAVFALMYMQTGPGDQVHIVGQWDRNVPPASDFTAGMQYPNADRFISHLSGSGNYNRASIESVSFGQGLSNQRDESPFFNTPAGYLTTNH